LYLNLCRFIDGFNRPFILANNATKRYYINVQSINNQTTGCLWRKKGVKVRVALNVAHKVLIIKYLF